MARLGHRGVQPQSAVRPIHDRVSSPATCCRAPTLDQKIATGFNRNHRGNGEGGIIPEEYAVEYVVDRVDTTATVWLGLTLGLRRCHSHKFDPIGQDEFYRFFAFFNNVPEDGRAVKYGNSPPYDQGADRRPSSRGSSQLEKEAAAALECAAADRATAEIAAAQAELGEAPLAAQRLRSTGRSTHDLILFRVQRKGQRRGHRRWATSPASASTTSSRFSAWVKPDRAQGGTILSRMVDEPQGEGYSVVLEQGKIQVNLVKRWLDDAIRVETKDALPPGAGRTSPSRTTARGWPRA